MIGKCLLAALLIGVAVAHFESGEFGGPRGDRRGYRPWFMRGHRGHGHGPWGPPPPPHHGGFPHPPPPPPPFLRNATEEARKEFFQIFENSNATKAEVKQSIQEWASKQPETVQKGVADFEKKLTAAKEETRQNATSVILQLQTAFDRFSAILEDDSLTPKETFEKMRNAARAFDRDVVFAVKMIMKNARRRIGSKYFRRPEHGPEGSFPPPPPPHGGPFGGPFPFPPPPPPGPEGPFDPFFPGPPPPPFEGKPEEPTGPVEDFLF